MPRGVRGSAQHGTRSRYVLGCRCDDCMAARLAYDRSRPRSQRHSAARMVSTWNARDAGRLAENFGITPLEEAVLIALHHIPARPFTNSEIAEVFSELSREAVAAGEPDPGAATHQAVSWALDTAAAKLRKKLAPWRDVA